MIVIGSVFRDSTSYLPRYFEQVKDFAEKVNEPVKVIAAEGDSTDSTWSNLRHHRGLDVTVLKVEHGGPKFGSQVHPLRWRQLSVPCNAVVCAAQRVVGPGDRFVYVESDLIWDTTLMCGIVDDLDEVCAVAPMSMIDGMARFYDIWGYTKDGKRFNSHPPYFPGYDPNSGLVPIDTCGSCFGVTAQMVPHIAFSHKDCIRGVGRSLWESGYGLFLDPTLAVYHPLNDEVKMFLGSSK
jgi:hypothetical protein